jgi:AraC-like DNA-binding protein
MAGVDILRTDQVHAGERFAHWRNWVSATFVPLEVAPVDRGPFRGEMSHWTLGDLHVSRVDADPHLASRTRRMIAANDQDYYKVGLQTKGTCQLAQGGHETTLRPGDLAIYDCGRPYTMVFGERFEMSFLMFPRDRLRLPPAAIGQVVATRVPSSESTASLVAPFLRRLVANLSDAPGEVNARIGENVLDLVATLFGELVEENPADPQVARRALLLRVCCWIDSHLGEPGLDPDTIAAANHISVRYLHQLFHDNGTSVARWVRARRLDNCRRDLEDPAQAKRGVLAIARRWGFDDPAHFSKVFRARYGEPPGRYRRDVAEHALLTNTCAAAD